MDVDDLRRFLVIAEERSLTRAAARLYVSQPTLSRLVHAVEAEVGAQLFERGARRLELTAAGHAFVYDAAQLVAAFRSAVDRARTAAADSAPDVESSLLRVGIFFPSAAELTWPILDAFQRRRPAVTLQPVDITALRGEHALLAGAVDVAFLWSPIASEDVVATTLFADPCVALLPAGHRLAGRETLCVAELSEEPYTVTRTMSPRWQAESTLEPWREQHHRAVLVKTVTEALQAVAAGRAVGVGPLSLSRYAPVRGLRYIGMDGPRWPTSLLCRRRSDRRGLIEEFVSLGASVARQHLASVPGARPADA